MNAVRDVWWCRWCEEEFLEPTGPDIWAPVVDGVLSKHCRCGRKLRRLTS